MVERWPPIYDAEQLASSIRDLVQVSFDQLTKNFFSDSPRERLCQGDIVRLESPIPIIHEDGQPAVVGNSVYWMIIGNTCDIDRDIQEVQWSQLVPLIDLAEDGVGEEELSALRRYRYSRRFYIPPWSREVENSHFIADFLRPVTVDKTALFDVAEIQTKMSYQGWILLHSCLVRFLARDDGRFD